MGRVDKYRKKIDSDVIKQRYDATKEMSVRAEKRYFGDAVKLETAVKQIVSTQPSITHHFYIAFAEEVVKKESSEERQLIHNKWKTRGLVAEVLNNISASLVGWISPIIPPPEVCRFDVGKFDINSFG